MPTLNDKSILHRCNKRSSSRVTHSMQRTVASKSTEPPDRYHQREHGSMHISAVRWTKLAIFLFTLPSSQAKTYSKIYEMLLHIFLWDGRCFTQFLRLILPPPSSASLFRKNAPLLERFHPPIAALMGHRQPVIRLDILGPRGTGRSAAITRGVFP